MPVDVDGSSHVLMPVDVLAASLSTAAAVAEDEVAGPLSEQNRRRFGRWLEAVAADAGTDRPPVTKVNSDDVNNRSHKFGDYSLEIQVVVNAMLQGNVTKNKRSKALHESLTLLSCHLLGEQWTAQFKNASDNERMAVAMLGLVLEFLLEDRAPRGYCDHCSKELHADHAVNQCSEEGCNLLACRVCTWESTAHILHRVAYGSFCVHHCKTAMETEIGRLKTLDIGASEVLCRATILCCHARTCVRACLRCVRACACACVRVCVCVCAPPCERLRVCECACVLLHRLS